LRAAAFGKVFIEPTLRPSSVDSLTAFEIVRLFIIVVGGVVLTLSTIFSRPWVFAAWVKPAFWILGLACIVWAALRLVLVLHGHAMSRGMYDFVDSQEPFLLGVASAMLILFFISGEALAV
jgi:hypothetical protein